jgi:methyl-accepting chemotaxis protein
MVNLPQSDVPLRRPNTMDGGMEDTKVQSNRDNATYLASELTGMIDAIQRVQAVIEFTLDGTIITANDNFLKTLGYTLDEIRGKHHRMFCDSSYVASSEYTEFWKRLAPGDLDAGEYKRIGRGGKEVWINASYYPLIGLPYKKRVFRELSASVISSPWEQKQ